MTHTCSHTFVVAKLQMLLSVVAAAALRKLAMAAPGNQQAAATLAVESLTRCHQLQPPGTPTVSPCITTKTSTSAMTSKLTNPSTKAAAAAAEAGSNTKQTNSSSSVHMAALTCACLPACLPPSLQLLRCLSSAQAALICNGETTRRLHPCAHLSRHLHSASARIQSSGTAGSLQAASARIRAGTLLQSDSSHYHHHLRALPSHVKQKSPPLPSCAQTASVPAAGCRHVQIMHLHRPSMIRCTAHHQQHFQAVLKQHPCCRLLPHTACISTALLPSGAQHTNRTSRLR